MAKCHEKLKQARFDFQHKVSKHIIDHVCKSLALEIIGTVEVPDRDATRTGSTPLPAYEILRCFQVYEEIIHSWVWYNPE